jgi:hypothetical protein
MSDDIVAYVQVGGGFAILVVSVFVLSGILEIAGAMVGVFIMATGFGKLRNR